MAKVVMAVIKLDKEVTELIKRIGSIQNPGQHVTRYNVSRDVGGPTLVSVTFIADEHFSAVEEKADE